mgnify:CR=1 FL=1
MSFFDECALNYEQYAEIQSELVEWGCEWLEGDLAGKEALELGAGTGLLTRKLSDTGINLLATDLSSSMLRRCQSNVPRVSSMKLDAWNPKKFKKFDRIYSSALLQWASCPQNVLSKWSSLLLPEGKILSFLFTKGTLSEFEEIEPGITSIDWFSGEEWGEHFTQAGFRVLRSEESNRSCCFTDALTILKNLRAIGAARRGIYKPGHLRQILQQYDHRCGLESGQVSSNWTFFRIEAVI